MHTQICTCIRTCAYVGMDACMFVFVCACVYTYVYGVYIYIYICGEVASFSKHHGVTPHKCILESVEEPNSWPNNTLQNG